ncbi:MAG: SMC-Scp complex subunit ScpB [Mucispirillum sp.]|nr:SMC-Scp complex subunit ScpB [Mucispirillum sp.]
MTQKPNNENNKKEDINTSPDSDIQELSDAFTSYMDDVISEEESIIQTKLEKESPVKDILPDFTSPYNADALVENENLDEEELSKQFDEGYFEKKEEEHSSVLAEDDYEDLSENREKRIFYAALYLSGKPVELATFRKMLNPLNLENRLINYAEEFNKLRIGVRIRMVSGGYQLVADSDVTGFLEKYFGEKTESLSRASLETAAIIAYRQPVTKAEVEEMREVNSSGTMKYLLDKNLIKVVGRKQVPGKPLLYATTKYFLEYFGLNDLSELPTFREWQELKQNS